MNLSGIVPFMMALDDFWGWINDAKMIAGFHGMPLHEALALRLVVAPVAWVESFDERFMALQSSARRDDIHDVLGGSDDAFGDNIAFVISLGREAYEELIADPASFGCFVSEYEVFAHAAHKALDKDFRKKHGPRAMSVLESAILGVALPAAKTKRDPLRV